MPNIWIWSKRQYVYFNLIVIIIIFIYHTRTEHKIQKLNSVHTHTHNRLPLSGTPGEPVPERWNQSGFYWSKKQWVAVASAGPYASLHLALDKITTPVPHQSVFYRPYALPAAQPTASKRWRHRLWSLYFAKFVQSMYISFLLSLCTGFKCFSHLCMIFCPLSHMERNMSTWTSNAWLLCYCCVILDV